MPSYPLLAVAVACKTMQIIINRARMVRKRATLLLLGKHLGKYDAAASSERTIKCDVY